MFSWKKKDEEAKKKDDEVRKLKEKNEELERQVAEIREKMANLPTLLNKESSATNQAPPAPQPQFQQRPAPLLPNPLPPIPSPTNWSPGGNQFMGQPPPNFGNMPQNSQNHVQPVYNQQSSHMGYPGPNQGHVNSFVGQPLGMVSQPQPVPLFPEFQQPPHPQGQGEGFRQNPANFQRNYQNNWPNQRGGGGRQGNQFNKREGGQTGQQKFFNSSNGRQQVGGDRNLRPEGRPFDNVKQQDNRPSYNSNPRQEGGGDGNLRPEDRRFDNVKRQDSRPAYNRNTQNNQENEKDRPLFQNTAKDRSQSQPRHRGSNDKREPANEGQNNERPAWSKDRGYQGGRGIHFNNSNEQQARNRQEGGHRGGRGMPFNYSNEHQARNRQEVGHQGGRGIPFNNSNEQQARNRQEGGYRGGRGTPFNNRNFNNRKTNFKRNTGKPRSNNQRDGGNDSDSDSDHSTLSGSEQDKISGKKGASTSIPNLNSLDAPCNSSENPMPDVVKNASRKKNKAKNPEKVEVLSKSNLGRDNILMQFIGTDIPSLVDAICLNVNLNTKVQDVIMMSDPGAKDPVLISPKNLIEIVNFKMKFQNAKSMLM